MSHLLTCVIVLLTLTLSVPLVSQSPQPTTAVRGDEEGGSAPASDPFSGLKARSIGPAVTSGRVMTIAVDPTNKSTIYIGAASGGVWKTTNGGASWQPIFDKQGSFSIGWITIDPQHSNIIWVGTGERN